MKDKPFEAQIFLSVVLFAAGLLILIFFPYLGAIVLAITLAILFHPVHAALRNIMPKWEGLAAFFTVVFAIIVILIPLIYFGYKIFLEAQGLYTNFSSGNPGVFSEFMNNQLHKFAPRLAVDFNQYAKQLLEILVGSLGSIFSRFASTAITLLLALISFFYLLKDGRILKKTIIRVSPLSDENTEKIIITLKNTANSVIRGSLVVAIAQGACVGLGFFLFGLQNPVLWGSVAMIVSIIPVIGIAFVVVPAILSMILLGNTFGAVGFGAFCFVLAALSDNFLRPLLVGRDLKIHPLLILFSVLGGLAVFGAMGLLLGPLALSLFIALLEIHPVLTLKRK